VAEGLEQSETGIAFAIVEPASLPAGPYSPQRERLILMGIVAGLGLGLVMAFVIERSDTTFGSVEDFQAFTTLPLMGVVPNVPIKEGKRRKGKNHLITLAAADSVAAEQYRILAMKLRQQCESSKAKVITITSAAGGEGKSLTAINLAMAVAAISEGPVLLVDADMRRPRIHEYLEDGSAGRQGLL
jgi:hypothetical protein